MDISNGSVLIHSGWVYRPFLYSFLKFRWLQHPIAPPELGRWGEWIALKYLRKLGWDIVARNWRGFQGEVDLIAYDGPFLVFVEVKTRRGPPPCPGKKAWTGKRKESSMS